LDPESTANRGMFSAKTADDVDSAYGEDAYDGLIVLIVVSTLWLNRLQVNVHGVCDQQYHDISSGEWKEVPRFQGWE
jgi:hypothetical protein